MLPAEPALNGFSQPFAKYFAATRPAFLSITLVACLIGLATARADGLALHADTALLTLFFALVAHAGVNVINDYYDACNGADAGNQERIFPFTGGSRFIQNGVLDPAATARFGYALLAAVIPAGLWLMHVSSADLFWIGLAGLTVGWAYSAPPLQLMTRGLGEIAILAGWLLVVAGTDLVQRGHCAPLPWLAGLPYALWVAGILYINEFPDRRADAAAGKRTLVVRLGPERARWGYPLIVGLAYGILLLDVGRGLLPSATLAAGLALPLAGRAARQLVRHAGQPAALAPAIRAAIAATHLGGLLLAVGLFFS
jgi:1,4-dihydroxy-2-naphthoate octaprenyltransferase